MNIDIKTINNRIH